MQSRDLATFVESAVSCVAFPDPDADGTRQVNSAQSTVGFGFGLKRPTRPEF